MLSKQEKIDLIDEFYNGDSLDLIEHVERAVLAKASQQVKSDSDNQLISMSMDQPVSMYRAVNKLIEAADILLNQKNYDGTGHELITEAKNQASGYLRSFRPVPAPKQEPIYQYSNTHNVNLWTDCNKETYEIMRPDFRRIVYDHPAPPQAAAIPEFLLEMSQQMRTQDNRGTSHPFFQVRCKRYIVTEQGYNEAGYELINDNGVVYKSYAADEEDLEQLLLEDYPEFCEQWRSDQGDETVEDSISSFNPEEDDLPDGLTLVYVQESEEIVSTHLTEAGARQFISRKQHDYPKLYTYAESAYWSPQLRQLQDWIISLSAPNPDSTGGESC